MTAPKPRYLCLACRRPIDSLVIIHGVELALCPKCEANRHCLAEAMRRRGA